MGQEDNVDMLMSPIAGDTNLEMKDDRTNNKTFRIRNYIPKKYLGVKSSKICNLVSSVVIGILIIAVIAVALNNRNINEGSDISENSEDHTISEYGEDKVSYDLILSDSKKLYIYDVVNKNFSLLHEYDKNISSFEVYDHDQIFWYEPDTHRILHMSNGTIELLLEESKVKPEKMAYDWIGKNLYIVDNSSGSIIVINVQTKKHDLILTTLIYPHDIDLDPERGVMFILQRRSIIRANMDGDSAKKIMKSNTITAIALDSRAEKIYWVDKITGIGVADYNGENIQHFMNNALNVIDLAIVDNQLFSLWLQNDIKPVVHHILSYKIDDSGNHEMHRIEEKIDFKSIKISNRAYSGRISNPCEINNNGCQHICLITRGNKSTCTCNLGWQLNPDMKTCREVQEFIIFTVDGFFRTRMLDNSRKFATDVFWPVELDSSLKFATGVFGTVEVKFIQNIIFDYDVHNDNVYFTTGMTNGGTNILTMKLKGKVIKSSILVNTSDNSILDLAYDSKTRNLYYQYRINSYGNEIVKYNIDTKMKQTVIKVPCEIIRSVNTCEMSMANNPRDNYLVYMKPFNSPKQFALIGKNSNGNELFTIENAAYYPTLDIKYRFITVDIDEQRIYWIADNNPMKIASANMNGQNIRYITGTINNIKSINVHRDWLYVSNHSTIWRVDKKNDEIATLMVSITDDELYDIITDVRIISQNE